MGRIKATKVNESYFRIAVDDGDLLYEIDSAFAIYKEGYEFVPAYKNHRWDGKIHYFKPNNRLFPIGLVDELCKYAKRRNHSIEFVNFDRNQNNWLSREKFEANVKQIMAGSKYTPRDYQMNAAFEALNKKRGILECCTSSGKSLMIYLILRNLMMEKGLKKMALIVPSIMLVTQMYKDFEDYGWSELDKWCEQQDKDHVPTFEKSILITTWQSLLKQDVSFFEEQQAVVCDECLEENTIIKTSLGDKKISDIKPGDLVLSYNEETGKFENKKVLEVFRNHNSSKDTNMLELELDNGNKIQITDNHPVLTKNRGWVRAGELNYDDDIFGL